MRSGITVRGTGRAQRTPDLATLSVSVDTQARTAGEAQSAASTRMRAVLTALREAGIADADIATQQIALNPAYDYSGSTPRMTGYAASQGLAIRVRRLDDLGRVIDTAVTAGATTVADVSLALTEPDAAMDEARDNAVADARRKAERLAAATGATLGAVIAITEGGRQDEPRPMLRAKMEMAAAADTPIAAGTTELTADVEVTWAILG